MRTKYPRKRLKSDVRIDYPGHLNGFATDVTVMAEGAAKAEGGQVETRVPFGKDVDLTHTVVGLTLRTDEFPRD